jgi:hypothetical protein
VQNVKVDTRVEVDDQCSANSTLLKIIATDGSVCCTHFIPVFAPELPHRNCADRRRGQMALTCYISPSGGGREAQTPEKAEELKSAHD